MILRRLFLPLFLLFLIRSVRAADVSYVPARAYAATAERAIDAAKTSVRLYLYIFNYRASQPNSLPARLARSLVRAKDRGVRVEVTLDPGDGVWQNGGMGSQNAQAVQFLREGGVSVFLSSGPLLHAKALVVDDASALLGSTNWSAAALGANAEANVLVRSPREVQALLRELLSVPRVPPPEAPPSFAVPEAFISREFLGRMVNRDDHRAVTACLYMWGRSAEVAASTAPFLLDGDALIKALDLPGPDRAKDRHQVRVVLTRLRDRYGLLDFSQDGYGEDFSISLRELPGGTVRLSRAYALHGWDRRLSLPGKVFTLLSLKHAARSPLFPRWSAGQRELTRQYGVSKQFLGHGVVELRRANLLEVEYAPFASEAYVHVRPSVYTSLPFYDPALLEARFQSLERAHGPAALARARSIAALLYEDADVDAVERFIKLEKEHGSPAVDRALAILGAKDPANPKRNVGYFTGTVESLSREKDLSPTR
jgi:hypothetical protein